MKNQKEWILRYFSHPRRREAFSRVFLCDKPEGNLRETAVYRLLSDFDDKNALDIEKYVKNLCKARVRDNDTVDNAAALRKMTRTSEFYRLHTLRMTNISAA